MTTPLDLSALEAVARQATPGEWRAHTNPWEVPSSRVMLVEPLGSIASLCDEADANHIATFDPPTVLALIEELKALRAEHIKVAAEREPSCDDCKDSGEMCTTCGHGMRPFCGHGVVMDDRCCDCGAKL